MAYQADEHNPDYLKKMLCQQNEKEIKIVASISSIMKTH